jgi:hypothetical protein
MSSGGKRLGNIPVDSGLHKRMPVAWYFDIKEDGE